MSLRTRWTSRAGITVAVGVALCLGSTAGVGPASAHVHASSDNAVRGAMAIVAFQVPNESDAGAATTALTITLPNAASARPEAIPGWTATRDADTASGTVRSVTWTAVPNGGIAPGQFGLFRISMKLPDTDSVSFPAAQSYSDGSVVKWDQPPLPGGGEPEHPAPRLTLSAGPAPTPVPQPTVGAPVAEPEPAAPKSPPDNTARLLAGAALLTGALGVCLALVRRRT